MKRAIHTLISTFLLPLHVPFVFPFFAYKEIVACLKLNENNIARFFVYFIAFFFYPLHKENNLSAEDFMIISSFSLHSCIIFCLRSA